MKRILVPTDFSLLSKASFRFALDLASRAEAEVFVVHMNEIPLLPETTFGIQPHPFDPDVLSKVNKAAQDAFETMRNEYHSNARSYFSTINDYVVPGLRLYIEENGIDLVVMSTHGASDLQEFFIGSTAEKIARFSPVPVISIPQETPVDKIKNIVFPSTLELDQDDLVNDLKTLQQLVKAKLHILLINTPLHFYDDLEAIKRLERFARHYDIENFTLNFRSHHYERTGILDFVNEIHADMIAMATHGRTGLAHFLKGSVAETVLNRIDQPIWTWNIKKHKHG
ncbi:MAG TPA: universal stress protein [Chryseosolibacter sp.]